MGGPTRKRSAPLNEEWRAESACREEPKWLFYVPKGEHPTMALAICRRCPVREECLTFALDHHIESGVWGGRTELQRRVIARQRRKSKVA